MGIPEENCAKIFSAFSSDHSVTRLFGGAGVGLGMISNLLSINPFLISLNSMVGVFQRLRLDWPKKWEGK